jgi:single-strand selective monofunctional uracil DNA glycosylase
MPETDPRLIAAARTLGRACDALRFADPVCCVYNPLDYAWNLHQAYLERFGSGPKRVLLLGMNPGPYGMAQTGVPFGEIAHVRDWMGLSGEIAAPAQLHPKRPIEGFACTRSEVSGRRLWSAFAERFGTPAAFFAEHFVVNYCPLVFMADTGRNITPDKLPAAESSRLQAACDAHLRAVVEILDPEWCIGIGRFARDRFEAVLGDGRRIGQVLHPSPASPAANRGWAAAACKQLVEQGIWAEDALEARPG